MGGKETIERRLGSQGFASGHGRGGTEATRSLLARSDARWVRGGRSNPVARRSAAARTRPGAAVPGAGMRIGSTKPTKLTLQTRLLTAAAFILRREAPAPRGP